MRLFFRFSLATALLAAFILHVLPARAGAPGVRWPCERTVAESGRTRMISFTVDAAPEKSSTLDCEVSNAESLEVVRGPSVAKGETRGYVRVRGGKPGEATLTVGGASLRVQVVEPRVAIASRPAIVGPADGAAVWRTVSVGVEMDGEAAGKDAGHLLRLSNGTELTPRRISDPIWGPTLRILYEINVFKMEPGALEMTPVVRRADGTEIAGETIAVTVLRPEAGEVIQMEAEDQADVKRPRRFGEGRLFVAPDKTASGHEFVNMFGSDPAACFPVKVEETGWFQAIVTVKGTFAGGAFPCIGAIVDGEQFPETNAVLLDEKWHRIALGVPFKLLKGDRFVTPYFLNDFYAGGVPADRNFFLDQMELVRVDTQRIGGEGSDPGGPMTAMGGESPGRNTWTAVRVAFAEPYDGRHVTGSIEIGGACWWRRMDRARAPKVTLTVNGDPVSTQRSAAPKWWVDPARLKEGDNALQLIAELDTGERATSTVQSVRWKAPWKNAAARMPMAFHRFTVRDEAWSQNVRKRFRTEGDCPEKVNAHFMGPETATLTLPEKLAGSFLVWVEGRGEHYDGAPKAEVTLEAGETKTVIGAPEIGGWWAPFPAGVAALAEGPKKLHVRFSNDKFDEGKGDRNLSLQGVILLGVPPAADARGPKVKILWPPEGHEVWRNDVVVVEPTDDFGTAWIELELDGKGTGIRADIGGRPGAVVLPLPLRGVAAGPHVLTAVAADTSGHDGRSRERKLIVAGAAPAEPGRYERAVHLLNRLAFGPDPAELAAVLTMGEDAWLADRLARGPSDPGDADSLVHACIVFDGKGDAYDVMGRDAHHACFTPNPVRTRFVRWVDNHFSTWIRKTGGRPEWEERRVFTHLGVAPFPDLLRASSTSPTMLQYLDQQISFARNLNENYAREIMELHTVGVHGGYEQKDVTALANLITGWMYANEGDGRSGGFVQKWNFRFDPALCDPRPQKFFGMNFPKAGPEERYDRARMAIELLAGHPSTAQFVCSKLVAHYIAWPAPEDAVRDLAKVFLETNGDMRSVLTALVKHPAFRRDGLREKVANPFDYSVRLSRACGFRLPWQVIDICSRSGAGLYDRPTPDGYQEEDTAWTSTNALLQRWKFSRNHEWALAIVVPGPLRWGPGEITDEHRQLLIDVCAIRLTGRVLGEESNAAAMDVLRACPGNRDELAHQAASFVAQLPEASVR